QPPPLVRYDASQDPALRAAVDAFRPGDARDAEAAGRRLREIGRLAGGAHAQEQGRLANENPPKLRTHDRYGHRVDEVEFHPAWHDLMATAIGHGLHATPWLAGTVYDPGGRPPADKRGLTAGMSMTEKQGGSDVRANTTTAAKTADGSYR